MPIRHTNWYNANSTRNYPLDDAATTVDDNGIQFPNDLLLDCKIRFPDTMGEFLYLSAIAITPKLVSVVFLASNRSARMLPDDYSSAGLDEFGAVPVATLTIQKPITPYRHYRVDSQQPGVAGWVVFGPGVDEPYSGRFSSPAQGLIMRRCGGGYRVPPVESIGKVFTANPLDGLVELKSGFDMDIRAEERMIEGDVVNAIVFGLANTLNRNVLGIYTGPNQRRPESGNCSKPAIQRIGPAFPDCNGNVTMDFRRIKPAPYKSGGGITLDLGIGLKDACNTGTPDFLPDDDGRLPGEGDDLCPWPYTTISISSSISCESLSSSDMRPECLPCSDGYSTLNLSSDWADIWPSSSSSWACWDLFDPIVDMVYAPYDPKIPQVIQIA